MNQRRRLREIRDRLTANGDLTVAAACKLLGASPATIRRDFRRLVEEGGAERAWGGIGRPAGNEAEPLAYWVRETRALEAKRAIALRASALIQDGDVVMLDGGTTTFQLAVLLTGRKVRLVTNSLFIALEVSRRQGRTRGAEVVLTGGSLYAETDALGGWHAEQSVRKYKAAWGFLSSSGIDRSGVTNNHEFVLGCEKAMIEQSERLVIMADSTKIGRRGMFEMCPWAEVDYFVTDAPSASPVLRRIAESDVKVLLARPEKKPRQESSDRVLKAGLPKGGASSP